jgi:hypothetical protein
VTHLGQESRALDLLLSHAIPKLRFSLAQLGEARAQGIRRRVRSLQVLHRATELILGLPPRLLQLALALVPQVLLLQALLPLAMKVLALTAQFLQALQEVLTLLLQAPELGLHGLSPFRFRRELDAQRRHPLG